jgi:LuxR family maltose regulon positive regulatory protein
MAEAPAGAPLRVAPPGRDVLLATKLHVPRPRPGFVPRPRLAGALDEGLARGLALVCAPAGAGKTALLADWAQHSRRPVAWLSLDRGDNDPARFWRHVVAALDRARPGTADRVAPLLGPPAPPSFEGLVATMVNELTTKPDEAVLVLDDYHLIDAPPIHSALAFLLDHLPPQLHLVMTTRADPPLPLTRLRARGQLTELRAADLRFTPDETAAFLTELMGLPLSADDVAVLEARTEGWIAGLQLAALAAREHAHPAQYIQAFTGDHRFIIDYLVDEVLERQPAHIKSFLLHTAILDRLCGPLCDAVMGVGSWELGDREESARPNPQPVTPNSPDAYSQRILEQLEHANLFLTALDDARRWYRYHPLFAEVLRSRLNGGASATEIAALHQRASAWLEQHGLLDDAIRQSLAAQDVNAAIRLIERAAPDLLRRGEVATLLGWIAQLSTTRALDHPQLCLFAAWAYATFGRWDDIDALLQRAEHGDLDLRQQGDVATLRALTAFGHGEINRAMDFAHAALAISEQLDMDGQAMRLHSPLLPIVMLAQSEAIRGQLRQAAETLQRALALARHVDQRGDSPLMRGIIHYSLSEVLYQCGDLTAAERAARAALAHSEQAGNGEIAAYSYAGLARIAQAHSNAELARQFMQQAEQRIRPRAIPDEITHVLALQARLWLAQGDLEAAQRWAVAAASAGAQLLSPREAVQMTLVRVYTALEQPDQAHDLIARLLTDAEAGEQQGRVIELLMLQALALSRQRHVARAHAALERALALAEGAGYVRLFVDEGALMGALLAQVAEQKSPVAGFATTLLEAFPRTEGQGLSHRSGYTQSSALVEPLSERELEVLHLIAEGHSNQAIADRMVVAVSTVKKHVNNLYGKLDVQSRTQALARASELHLL